MKKYIGTSHTVAGAIYLCYNANGQLVAVDISEAQLNELQHTWLLKNLPLTEEVLPKLATAIKYIFSEVLTEVTFERFYDEYGVKEARKKAQNAWDKLNKNEQLKAYNYIPKLRTKTMNASIAMPYPATYLNQQRWND